MAGHESRPALRSIISTLPGFWIRLHTHSPRGRDRSAGRIEEESAGRAEGDRGENRGAPETVKEGKRLERTPSPDSVAGRPLDTADDFSEPGNCYQSHALLRNSSTAGVILVMDWQTRIQIY